MIEISHSVCISSKKKQKSIRIQYFYKLVNSKKMRALLFKKGVVQLLEEKVNFLKASLSTENGRL